MSDENEGNGTVEGDDVIPDIKINIKKDETRGDKPGDSLPGGGVERRGERGGAPA